jgi:hypothetical protein
VIFVDSRRRPEESPVNVSKNFGSTSGRTVFPMVSISTLWSRGGVLTTTYRGWDVNVTSSSTELAATSGTGE